MWMSDVNPLITVFVNAVFDSLTLSGAEFRVNIVK
jgi:hypothetical protein